MPGHTGGWAPLRARGLQWCGSWPAHQERPQLFNDPGNVTRDIVVALFEEMATLFPDE